MIIGACVKLLSRLVEAAGIHGIHVSFQAVQLLPSEKLEALDDASRGME